jgi:hypothetical protein
MVLFEQKRAGPASRELKSADEIETLKKDESVIMVNAGKVLSSSSPCFPLLERCFPLFGERVLVLAWRCYLFSVAVCTHS